MSETRDGSVRFGVRAQPRARASRVVALREGDLVVQLAAPPVDGAANAELVELLARVLSVPKRDVEVVRGETARSKIVEVRGLTVPEARARMTSALG
ncbi:MAG: DUF167 domain-containing protein [Polyangiaceae bacterium]